MKQTVAFKKNERNIFFHILTRCNLKCRHCYINPRQHGKETLPADTVMRWLRTLFDAKKETNVIFLGGEPTLHPELDLCIKEARKIGYRSITVDTNGYLFNDILNKVTPEEVDYLSFSLDGATKTVNDKIRGKGCYKKCTEGIKKAVSKGFRTSLIFTVSRLNIHELGQMPPLLNSLGIDRFFIQVIGLRGTPAKKRSDLQLTKEEWSDLVPKVAQEAASLGIRVTYPKVFLEKNEPFECAGVVADNFFIFPNGRVYQCPLCEDFAIHSHRFKKDTLTPLYGIRERELFQLSIPEGCVMNKILQPGNLRYDESGTPEYKIACCLLKETVLAHSPARAGLTAHSSRPYTNNKTY
ncbi:MAG: radical SAM protein [Deltaproteobacteria bacterium]|nr:radical SAM protein [Deltaproteobacteria bacterium]